jgi:hypothetical protein
MVPPGSETLTQSILWRKSYAKLGLISIGNNLNTIIGTLQGEVGPCTVSGDMKASDLPARPKSRMPVEASRVKPFPRTLPAQLLTAHSSGFRFHKPAVRPTAQFHDVCIQKPLAAFINHVAMCAGTTF